MRRERAGRRIAGLAIGLPQPMPRAGKSARDRKRASLPSRPRGAPATWVGALALVAGIGALAACGAPKEGPAPSAPAAQVPESAVSRFFPLVDGTQWAYDAAEDETGNQGVFVTRAKAMAGPRFSLVTGQRSRIVEVRAEGITRVESGVYLLRAPLTEGAEWPGEGGAVVRVVAIDRVVDVPAGKYVGCLDTVEEQRGPGGEPARRITTTYCPEVGIAILHAEAWENGRHVGERAVLRSYGKPISILKN